MQIEVEVDYCISCMCVIYVGEGCFGDCCFGQVVGIDMEVLCVVEVCSLEVVVMEQQVGCWWMIEVEVVFVVGIQCDEGQCGFGCIGMYDVVCVNVV